MSDKNYNPDSFSGFDSADRSGEENFEEQRNDLHEGYTLSPNGGYYESTSEEQCDTNNNEDLESGTAPKTDDVPTPPEPTTAGAAQSGSSHGSASFFPNGNYGNEQSSFATGGTYYDPSFHRAAASVNHERPPKPPKPVKPPKAPKEKKDRHFGLGSLIAVALITAILCSGCFYALTKAVPNTSADTASADGKTQTTEKVVEINGSIEELAEAAANKAGSSVVGVQTTFAVQNFFSGQSTSSGSGSGVIYKSDGYIITNYHVIADAIDSQNSTITVFLDNNSENGYEASVINYNISCDLAVLKIDKTGLNAIDIGDSDELKIGQYVVAIGSPGGLEFMGSTTFGIVSGLNREISTTTGNMTLIQTDAAINPGNSGGALVNTKGELIGISSSKLVDTSYEGMGFAIPVNTVVRICDNLIAHEGEGDPYTGISISSNYTANVLKYYGYPVGAVVAGVDAGSPAESAGIQRGDIITQFGDTEITESTMYSSALANYFPGDKVEVTYYRSGQTKTATLTVGSAN